MSKSGSYESNLSGEEMNKRKYIFLAFALSVAGVWFISRDYKHALDYSSDEPPFNTISMPPKEVRSNIWFDGGSVSVRILDRDDSAFHLIFPVGKGARYTAAFYGGDYPSDPKAVELKHAARARSIALELIARYDSQGKDGSAFRYLSGRERSEGLSRLYKSEGIAGILRYIRNTYIE